MNKVILRKPEKESNIYLKDLTWNDLFLIKNKCDLFIWDNVSCLFVNLLSPLEYISVSVLKETVEKEINAKFDSITDIWTFNSMKEMWHELLIGGLTHKLLLAVNNLNSNKEKFGKLYFQRNDTINIIQGKKHVITLIEKKI